MMYDLKHSATSTDSVLQIFQKMTSSYRLFVRFFYFCAQKGSGLHLLPEYAGIAILRGAPLPSNIGVGCIAPLSSTTFSVIWIVTLVIKSPLRMLVRVLASPILAGTTVNSNWYFSAKFPSLSPKLFFTSIVYVTPGTTGIVTWIATVIMIPRVTIIMGMRILV